MIIRSQDKKYTTTDLNLEIVTRDICTMSATTFEDILNGKEMTEEKKIESKIYNSVGLCLGIYSTEEKAIKVLDMIQNAYERQTLFSITYQDGMMSKLERENGLVCAKNLISPVFQMPQDSEV
jgi:hypothetical protein